MHSTLRKELRGTQRVFQQLCPQATRRVNQTSRAFSSKYQLRQDHNKPSSGNLTGSYDQSNRANSDVVLPRFRPAELGLQIERWINELSNHGRPLHVWDTISQKDDHGKWRLLPQVKKDLEEVEKWAKESNATREQPFGIKIEDGRIKGLSTPQLRQEQGLGQKDRIIQGPFVPAFTEVSENTGRSDQVEASSPEGVTSIFPEGKPAESDALKRTLAENSDAIPNDPSPLKFHGSAAARRQRSQRLKEKILTYSLPKWFYNANVSILDGGDPSSLTSSTANSPSLLVRLSEALPALSGMTAILSQSLQSRGPQDTEGVPESKKQTHGRGGGDDDTPAGESGPSSNLPAAPSGSPTLVPLTPDKALYFIQESQYNELTMTAKGRLRLPATRSTEKIPGGIRNSLVIHYTAPDADIWLDNLVKDLSRRLHCDLISLDVQDLASLVLNSDIDMFFKEEAASLSYEVLHALYRGDNTEAEQSAAETHEESEEAEEESGPGSQGIPFIIGKPIHIDLKALFSPNLRSTSGARVRRFASSYINGGDPSRPTAAVFSPLIDSILTSARYKKRRPETASSQSHDFSEMTRSLSKDTHITEPTIVHIKDFRQILHTNLGQQFLYQLHDQVEHRRSAGQPIMIVGTECNRAEGDGYDAQRIRDMQMAEISALSTILVVTPHRHGETFDAVADRESRLKTVNARHLWQMLQSKDIKLNSLPPGCWTSDFVKSMHAADQGYLAKGLWPFGFIQRLAAVLADPDLAKSQHCIAEAIAVLEISDKSKVAWAREAKQETANDSKPEIRRGEKDRLTKIRETASKHEKRLLGGVVEPKKISTTFNDIHIPAETIDALQTLTTLSLVRPDAFKYGVLASDRIPGMLLYGPPGTGKTLAAKAVAKESGATMLEVSAADINDMYVGEGEKNVKALFSLAKKLSPCVVFLDEADAMFSARSSQGRRASHRELLNQFLREWDGMSNDAGSAFIMVATNRPMDLDDAVLRRLPRRLLVDLPAEIDRLEILKIHLRHEQLADDVNLSQLATKTPFYSGSDLKNVVVAAALNAVREENELAKKETEDEPYQYPAKRVLKAAHFDRALEEISASISEDMSSLRAIKKFDEQYGDRRSRKRKSAKWGFRNVAEADEVLDTVKVRS